MHRITSILGHHVTTFANFGYYTMQDAEVIQNLSWIMHMYNKYLYACIYLCACWYTFCSYFINVMDMRVYMLRVIN